MGKPLEVHEFEAITCEQFDTINYGKYQLSEKEFFELESFIEEYNSKCESADVLDFMRIGFKRNVGKYITIKNYVGLIQMNNGFQVQVLPKIDFDDEDADADNSETKALFIKMLRSLKNFPGKIFSNANLSVGRMILYEIFINMYLQECWQLVKHGIKSSYVEQTDNLNYYKGKLLVAEHIRRNIAHRERAFVVYDNYQANIAENRIVKATLLKLQKLTNSAENSREIRKLLVSFEMVESSGNYEKDFSRIVINRNTKDYENLLVWSRVFLMNESFTTFSGSTISRSLLFPMESVYESYVAKEMKKALTPYGWKVSCQDKGYYLFDEPRKKFALRPDIVIKKDGRTVVMDTKWKKLIPDERKNYGISQADMYQMYAYSKKYGNSDVWLLYPYYSEIQSLNNKVFKTDDNTTVRLWLVDLKNIEENFSLLRLELEL
ncbi:MAG: restriction endonuclease [Lachnospiraceae bacterium]|nr:restriction endonuclease [Lachnospiraceae bacterium]